jgi:hypothetical protein
MASGTSESRTDDSAALDFGSPGKPIKLNGFRLAGIAAEAAQEGQEAKLWVRLGCTSDQPMFHKIAKGFVGHLNLLGEQANQVFNVEKSKTLLLVVKENDSAELWLDTAVAALQIVAKRAVTRGAPVFDRDIADIVSMRFPNIELDSSDRVFCVFRVGWKFALLFDFNPDKDLDVSRFEKGLGSLYRSLAYQEVYDAVGDVPTLDALIRSGWFPFVEILGSEVIDLIDHSNAGFDLKIIEAKLLQDFDDERIENLFERWMAMPLLKSKEIIFRSAMDAFKRDDPVSTIKTILTEIEGLLADAHIQAFGKSARLKDLLDFATLSGAYAVEHDDNLLFPKGFAQYLRNYVFANFDPVNRQGNRSSRHAVGHGMAEPDSYTQTRALQAILTLDQLAFFAKLWKSKPENG